MNNIGDLEISIQHYEENSYRLDYRFSDSDPQNQVEVRPGPRQQIITTLDINQLNQCLEISDMKAYGEILTAMFFHDEGLKVAFAQVRSSSNVNTNRLRIRLHIQSSAAELHRLRWETLNDPQSGFSLSTDQTVFFSRYLSSQDWRSVRLRSKREMRVLVAIASPSGLKKYGLARVNRQRELKTISLGLNGIMYDVLERASLNDITSALTHQEYDVFYLVAHGLFNRQNSEPILWLEDEARQISRVSGVDLINRLHDLEHRPALVVLTSCQSAGRGQGDVLSALGPGLTEAGIPAVLAMQDNFSMDTAKRFMPVFFAELCKDGYIDRALSVARGLVRERLDWWVPLLFMRLKSGKLWYTPGFGGDFKKWPSLLESIQSGCCTPILGPGLTDSLTGSLRDLAQQWSEELQYPLASHERESLPQVAQFRAVDQSRFTAEKEWRKQLRSAILKHVVVPLDLSKAGDPSLDKILNIAGQRLRELDPFECHKILSHLPVKVYITANPDELLEDALCEAGKAPRSMVCPWREFNEQDSPSGYGNDDTYEPTLEKPLVYHLFGKYSQPNSLVLTEDDTFEFLIGITLHRKRIPDQVGRSLADSALLFLGFQAEEWNFRVLLHALLGKEGSSLLERYAHIAAQIEPEESHFLNPDRARRYLETYFAHRKKIEINIYWGSPEEFVKELAQRLRHEQA